MKKLFWGYCVFLICAACDFNTQSSDSGWKLVEKGKIPDSMMVNTDSVDTMFDFHLTYCVAGMGSNMGKRMPYFEVIDSHFVFTLRQNSNFGSVKLNPDTIQTGFFQRKSQDEILELVDHLPDTVISKMNLGIMSGSINSLVIRSNNKKVTISMHNCFDETAAAVVDILNTYITGPKKLFVSEFPAEDYGM